MRNEEETVLYRIYKKGNIVDLAESHGFNYNTIVKITRDLIDAGMLTFDDEGLLIVTELGESNVRKLSKPHELVLPREDKQIVRLDKDAPYVPHK